ncbi:MULTISPECIES: DUF948 domain-containing protein [unclassified Enterococcus]|uniref:DUF948 domain-containing protein n=1 Tax=unclassified Enterococcus TaxID=2608891 RepID=UPI00155395B3|nr:MULTISPECIES: DUF948 domain-containing protein [unclassified Enterococcus]MBS7577549.1 DUF948 domain-containing protein [Enterococcus sp. MMGLQ5-2]MBS7584952.1 DUF948 domain-containing protein [Enterococcus sp. MMGLQ5-1]NPD12807.1 DUF948 domain-containing protein [Enterococcus sp. MMGLQ5-1]NPD37382.1 DUF948 domain-containing protein [Enterococcus sp. MMGLQ5-2]
MNGVEIAAIIFAIAFVVLVFFIVQVLREVREAVAKANQTVEVLSSDAHVLLHQADELMTKTNVLLNDVNGKVATIDPLFEAIADLSITVTDLNDSSRNFVTKVNSAKGATKKAGVAMALGRTGMKLFKKKGTNPKSYQ